MPNVTRSSHAPLTDLVRVVISFAIGLTITAALVPAYYFAFDAPRVFPEGIWTGFGLFVFFLLIALVLGLPVLVAACVILFVFHNTIIRNLAIWCVITPVIVVAMYLGIDQMAFNKSGSPVIDHLTHESVIYRAGIAFIVSIFTTAIFYFWHSRTKAGGEQASQR